MASDPDIARGAVSTALRYSLVGRTIDVPGFIERFRQGAQAHAGQSGTLGAKYSTIGDRFCIPNLSDVASRINHDPAITDVRWAAYMLATTYWESAHIVDSGIKRKHGHGDYRVTETFVPVEESDKGGTRAYAKPVRVARSGNGARVTASDGKVFLVAADGSYHPEHEAGGHHHRAGTSAPHHAAFGPSGGAGVSKVYFGRGYVQLTWWYNYAKAGAATGKGLDFLFDPDLVLDADNAYRIMSTGMCNGTIFANGHRFSDYFIGAVSDYAHARHMVNGMDQAETIASIARAIEACLMESITPKAAA